TQFTKHFDYNFYVPDCAELVNVKTYSDSIYGYFIIEGADWEVVHEEYEAAFEAEDIYNNNSDFQSKSVEMRVELSGGDYTRVHINENDEGNIELELRYDYPE